MEELTIDNNDVLSETGNNNKAHPWRLCPLGKHYVREHKERIHQARNTLPERLLFGMHTARIIH